MSKNVQINITDQFLRVFVKVWREQANNRWYFQYAVNLSTWGSGLRLAYFIDMLNGKPFSHPGFESKEAAKQEVIAYLQGCMLHKSAKNMFSHSERLRDTKLLALAIKQLKSVEKTDDLCIISSILIDHR